MPFKRGERPSEKCPSSSLPEPAVAVAVASRPACTIETVDGVLTVTFTGPTIGHRDAPRLLEAIGPALDTARGSVHTLLLDMHAVALLAGSGLGMCVELHRRARGRGLDCRIRGVNRHLHDLFRMMKVDRLYTIVTAPPADVPRS